MGKDTRDDLERESPTTSVPEPSQITAPEPESSENPSEGSEEKKSKTAGPLDTFNGMAASFVSPFRPGRLTPTEILTRLFPHQRKAVLELVLQGCSGDLVKAIEHFLSAGEAAKNGGSVSRSELAHSSSEKDAHSYRAPSSHPSVPGLGSSMFRSPLHVDKLGVGSLKSAFTPLPPATTSALPLLFSHRPPNPFQTDAFLGRTPLFAPTGLSDIHASAASPGRFIFPAMHPLNLSGKLAAAAASDAYPRYLFAPYASCPPDCTQYPGLHGTRAPGGSTGSDSEKSPGAIADLSVTSNVDSDWGFVIYVCIRLRRI